MDALARGSDDTTTDEQPQPQLYGFGANECNQLGLQLTLPPPAEPWPRQPDVLWPTIVDPLPGRQLASYHCGGGHTLFLCPSPIPSSPPATPTAAFAAVDFWDRGGRYSRQPPTSNNEARSAHMTVMGTAAPLELWGVGYNGDGQLGVRERGTFWSPVTAGGLSEKRFRLLISGDYHTLAVCGGGRQQQETWSFGNNDHGQLGVGDTMTRPVPMLVTTLHGKGVVTGACGSSHTVLVCTVSGTKKKAAPPTAGATAATATTNENDQGQGTTKDPAQPHPSEEDAVTHAVWVFGCNDYGQLGVGPTKVSAYPLPQYLPRFAKGRVLQVRCGGAHTFLICSDPDNPELQELWCCGRNDFGQLGLGDTENRYVPVRHPSLSGILVEEVHCGDCHTVVVYRSAAEAPQVVCSFGENYYGQLGLGDRAPRCVPSPLPDLLRVLEGRTVRSLHGGGHFCLMVCVGSGVPQEVCGFGRNDRGQLGLGDTQHRLAPVRIPALSGKFVADLQCGHHHTLLRCTAPASELLLRIPAMLRTSAVRLALRQFVAACTAEPGGGTSSTNPNYHTYTTSSPQQQQQQQQQQQGLPPPYQPPTAAAATGQQQSGPFATPQSLRRTSAAVSRSPMPTTAWAHNSNNTTQSEIGTSPVSSRSPSRRASAVGTGSTGTTERRAFSSSASAEDQDAEGGPLPRLAAQLANIGDAGKQCEAPLLTMRAEGGALLLDLERLQLGLQQADTLAREEEELFKMEDFHAAGVAFDQRVDLLADLCLQPQLPAVLAKGTEPIERTGAHIEHAVLQFINLQQAALRCRVDWQSLRRQHEERLTSLRGQQQQQEDRLGKLTAEAERLQRRLAELQVEKKDVESEAAITREMTEEAEAYMLRLAEGDKVVQAVESATASFQAQLTQLSLELHSVATELESQRRAGQVAARAAVEEWIRRRSDKLRALEQTAQRLEQDMQLAQAGENTEYFLATKRERERMDRRQTQVAIQTLRAELDAKRALLSRAGFNTTGPQQRADGSAMRRSVSGTSAPLIYGSPRSPSPSSFLTQSPPQPSPSAASPLSSTSSPSPPTLASAYSPYALHIQPLHSPSSSPLPLPSYSDALGPTAAAPKVAASELA